MNNIIKRGFKQGIFPGIVLLLFIVLSFPLIINGLINTQVVKKKISSIIYQKTGTLIDASKFSIVAFPQPSLEFKNFNIKINKSFQLDIARLQFNIDLLRLLRGHVQVGQIVIERPSILALNQKTESSEQYIHSMSFVEFGRLNKKIFSNLSDYQNSIELIFKDILSPYFESMNGSITLSRKKQDIVFNYTINNFNLQANDLKSFDIQEHLLAKRLQIKTIKAIIKLNASGTLEGKSDFEKISLYGTKENILFDSNQIESNFLLSEYHQQISILPFDVNFPNARVGVAFSNNLKTNESRIDFNGSNIHVGQARQMSLNLFKNNEVVPTLFDILRDGFVHSIVVSFASNSLTTLFDDDHLELTGYIENGHIKIPNTNLFVSKISADASIKKGVLDIQAKTGLIQGSNIKKGDLSIDLLNYVDYPFNGDFQLDIDLSQIPETLIGLLPETQLAQELALVKQIFGRADTSLSLVLKTESDDLDVIIKTKDFSTTGQYERIPGDIKITHINFSYDSDVVEIGNLTGSVQNSSLAGIDAIIDFNDQVSLNIQSGSGNLDLSFLTPWLLSYQKPRQFLSPIKKAGGTLNFSSLSLQGLVLKPELWTYQIMGDSQNISASTRLDQNQIENLYCQYQLSNNQIQVNDIHADLINIPELSFFLKNEILNNIKVPFQIKNARFNTKPDQTIVNGELIFSSGPELKIDLAGQSFDTLQLKQIKLKDKSFSNATITPVYKGENTLFDFQGCLDTQTFDNLFNPNNNLIKKIHNFTRNQPVEIYSDEQNNLIVHAKHIDLNPFLPLYDSVDFDHLYLPNHSIDFKADFLEIKKLKFTNTMARLSLKNDHFYIRLDQAFLCNLKTSGYISFKDNMIFANLPFESKDKNNAQDLFTCLMKKEKFMDGQYSLTGNLLSSSMQKDFWNKIEGGLNFNADNGRIYKLTLLSRILSVLNVSSFFKGKIPNILQQGFAYKKITIETDIKESKIFLKNAVIDGTDMTMIFKGWIDPVNDQLDLTCLVAPFKTIDLIIQYIPIINTMLDGRLISVPVKATGKLSDPIVTPLHPSAVGTGLINMMSDILKTPVKLWDKISNDG